MLNRVIRWFEIEPVGTLLSYDPDAMRRFVYAGALTTPKRTRYATCRVCKASRAVQVYGWGEHSVRCEQCGGLVDFGIEFESVKVRSNWLPDALAIQFDAASPSATPVIDGRLWRLNPSDTKATAVYLLRSSLSLDVAPVIATLNREPEERRRLVIVTSPLRTMPKSTAELAFLPLDEVAHMEVEGIRLDVRRLLPHLVEQAPLWFELPPPFTTLLLGGESLPLRRGQSAFMRLLAEAHTAGVKKSSWRGLLKRAGYKGDYSSLSQLFPDDAFRFIGTSKDDVWIRKAPLPQSQTGPPRRRKSIK